MADTGTFMLPLVTLRKEFLCSPCSAVKQLGAWKAKGDESWARSSTCLQGTPMSAPTSQVHCTKEKAGWVLLTTLSHLNTSLSHIHSVWKSLILNKFLLRSKQNFSVAVRLLWKRHTGTFWNLTFSHTWKLGYKIRQMLHFRCCFLMQKCKYTQI